MTPGTGEPTARADARLAVAVVRGLLHLLATGDRGGTTEAYERFLARAPATAAPAPGMEDSATILIMRNPTSGACAASRVCPGVDASAKLSPRRSQSVIDTSSGGARRPAIMHGNALFTAARWRRP